jgi:hypothetical protein
MRSEGAAHRQMICSGGFCHRGFSFAQFLRNSFAQNTLLGKRFMRSAYIHPKHNSDFNPVAAISHGQKIHAVYAHAHPK